MDHVRQEVVRFARAEIGPQVKGSPQVYAYWRDVLPPAWSDAQVRLYAKSKEWCGGFALWCIRRAGLAGEARWVDGLGFLGPSKVPRTASPEAGDVAFFPQPFQHHAVVDTYARIADLVVKGTDGQEKSYPRWRLVTIDGNQPDCRERVREIVPALRWNEVAFFSIEPFIRAETPTLPDVPPLFLPTVRRGTTGSIVKTLQMRLALVVDGSFGPKTEAAVIAFQRSASLVADGIVGPKTWAALGLK